MLPLTFANPADFDLIEQEDTVVITGIHAAIRGGKTVMATLKKSGKEIALEHAMSPRQIDVLIAGGLINWVKHQS